jgi:hypothetical protein
MPGARRMVSTSLRAEPITRAMSFGLLLIFTLGVDKVESSGEPVAYTDCMLCVLDGADARAARELPFALS